LILEYSS